MAKTTKMYQEICACVKDKFSSNHQLTRLAQQVSLNSNKEAVVLSFSPPIAASTLAKALLSCES